MINKQYLGYSKIPSNKVTIFHYLAPEIILQLQIRWDHKNGSCRFTANTSVAPV